MCAIELRLAAEWQLFWGGYIAGKGGIGPGAGVVVVGMVRPAWRIGAAAIVETAEDVKALAVDVKVEDHHDEEVYEAEQQHSFADPLQSAAQHQPAHCRGHAAPAATGIRSAVPPASLHLALPCLTSPHLWAAAQINYLQEKKWQIDDLE